MPTIKYSDNPNEETAFVTQDGGQRNRAVLTAAVDGTIEYSNNPNSTKVMVTVDGVKRRAVAVADIAGGGGGGDQHNLGWYATETALTTAHPTASDGDYAIVGDTDTVWVWDSDTTAWVDSGAGGIGLPDQTGHSGDFLMTDGTDASWSSSKKGEFELWRPGASQSYALKLGINPSSSATSPDRGVRLVGGNNTLKILQWVTGYSAALEADVVEPGTGSTKTLGTSTNNNSSWNNVYTKKINAGSGANDIIVPTEGGSMAVIQVNTAITLTAADWSSNTQTVSVTGMTATGVVLVSPDPTDQSAYTSAGILCTAQGTNSLTFTATTTPTSDIDVNVVCL